jgi:hypothetical protein
VPTRSPRLSTLGHHKAGGQGVVRLNNRDPDLGKYRTPERRAASDRLIGEGMANGRQTAAPGSDLTIAECMLAWRGRSRPQYESAERRRRGRHRLRSPDRPNPTPASRTPGRLV